MSCLVFKDPFLYMITDSNSCGILFTPFGEESTEGPLAHSLQVQRRKIEMTISNKTIMA